MFQRGYFLVLVPDDGLAETVLEPVQRYSVTRRATSVAEALELLTDAERWSGVIVDLDSLGADGFGAVVRVRQAYPLMPMLLLSGGPTAELINRVHAMRAELVCKPVSADNLVSFVQRALVNGWLPDERVSAWVDELSKRQGLTAREVQLMAYALGNEPRGQVMRRLGITENTLKTQVRALLRKCGARSMDELAKNVLRDALLFDVGRQEDMSDSGEYRIATA